MMPSHSEQSFFRNITVCINNQYDSVTDFIAARLYHLLSVQELPRTQFINICFVFQRTMSKKSGELQRKRKQLKVYIVCTLLQCFSLKYVYGSGYLQQHFSITLELVTVFLSIEPVTYIWIRYVFDCGSFIPWEWQQVLLLLLSSLSDRANRIIINSYQLGMWLL